MSAHLDDHKKDGAPRKESAAQDHINYAASLHQARGHLQGLNETEGR